jgi:bidirectional [NiFe] hydrogenase diaphorase subunit
MMITLSIDEKTIEAQENATILETARKADIAIPTLCYNSYLKPYGGCRMCLVEVENPETRMRPRLVSSCTFPVENGLVVRTKNQRVLDARKFILELLLARCPESPEIQEIAREYGVPPDDTAELDTVGRYLLFRAPKPDQTKCILCGLCVRVCSEVVQRNALSLTYRGSQKKVKTPFDRVSKTCIGCGSCAYLCPTNAITVEEET